MTGSCAQRRRWSRLRAWIARGLAVAGITGGAWLLGAGLAAAAPQPHLVAVPAVVVTTPDIAVAPEADSAATHVESAGISAQTASDDAESAQAESTSTHDAGRQLGVELATSIASDVHAQLNQVDEPEVADPAEPSLPDTDAPEPAGRTPGTSLDDPSRSGHTEPARPTAPNVTDLAPAPPPAPAAEPATVESDHFTGGTGTDHAADEHRASANQSRDEHRHPPASTPHPVPPISPPAAPTATATSAPTGPGHGLRWMHAVLPTQPFLPGPTRAAGGHAEAEALRGTALIEPSASPD